MQEWKKQELAGMESQMENKQSSCTHFKHDTI